MKWVWYVTNDEKRIAYAYRVFMGKPEAERPLGRSRHRWENNILMDLGEISWGGMEWVHLAQDGDNYSC
jgi:hypothetical protein